MNAVNRITKKLATMLEECAATALRPLRHRRVQRLWRRTGGALERALAYGQTGQSMVEYAVVVALVAIAAMVAVQLLGTGIGQVFTNILGKIQGLGR